METSESKIPIPEIPELASDLSGDTMVYLALWKIWVRQWERLIIPYIFIYYYGKIKNIWNHQHNSSMLHVVKEVTTLIKSCKNGSCATIRTHKTHGLQSQFSQWSKLHKILKLNDQALISNFLFKACHVWWHWRVVACARSKKASELSPRVTKNGWDMMDVSWIDDLVEDRVLYCTM